MLSEILRSSVGGIMPKELMVGIETADDAAVYRLNDEQALIATTDFFMPIVDDPFDFGRIAATNAISDVYAMGGKPIMALALVAMPIDKLTVEQIGAVIRGGESVCREAGIPIAGGHTIDSVEPIYGLVVMGLVHPDKVRRNADAKAGDVLVLGKPIGVGVLSAALKKNALDPAGYARLIATTTRLNTPGIALAAMPGVHAITDVTGFGLAGHALEMARGAKLGVTIDWAKVPLLDGVAQMAGDGFVTGASGRNWAGYGAEVALDPALPPVARDLLTDPQTSGGLLVSCDPGVGGRGAGARSAPRLRCRRGRRRGARRRDRPQRPGLTPARFSDVRADVGRGSGGGFFGRSDAVRRRREQHRPARHRRRGRRRHLLRQQPAQRRRGDAGARLGALGDLRRQGAHQLRRMRGSGRGRPRRRAGRCRLRLSSANHGSDGLVEHHRRVARLGGRAPTRRAGRPAPRR